MPGPALVVQGTRDQYGTIAHARFLADRAQGPIEVAEVDGAHAPHLEAREATMDAIQRFLDMQYISCIPKISAL